MNFCGTRIASSSYRSNCNHVMQYNNTKLHASKLEVVNLVAGRYLEQFIPVWSSYIMVNEPAFILALSSFTERFKLDGFFWHGNLILWSNLNSECILLYI